MFETYEHAEIPLPVSLCPNGERLWSYAHIDIYAPWFYVESAEDIEGLTSSSMYLLSSVDQLRDLAGIPYQEIISVNIVTPRHVNQTRGWQMDALKEVIQLTFESSSGQIKQWMYVLEDGRELLSSETPEGTLSARKVWYPI